MEALAAATGAMIVAGVIYGVKILWDKLRDKEPRDE